MEAKMVCKMIGLKAKYWSYSFIVIYIKSL